MFAYIYRYETYFVFACVWGFGSALFQDQIVDWRNEFSKWFTNEFKQIKFPTTGNVFSFFIDPETKKFLPWSEKVEAFELDPDLPLQVFVGYLMNYHKNMLTSTMFAFIYLIFLIFIVMFEYDLCWNANALFI